MIRVTGLSKSYRSEKRQVTAIANATITVGDDEIVVLLGPSGSGKTTLLRCVAGLETANEGEIEISDRLVFSGQRRKNVPAEHRNIGMVFQSYAIWPHLTVAQNVALPLTHGSMGIPRADVTTRVYEALRAVQLAGLEDRPTPQLSGGQQQRVALARALAVQPDALLMDEPLSNLDARLREEVRFEIRQIAKQIGVPVLYVTHDQVEALDLADRVAVMDRGRILQIDTPEGVYDRPCCDTVASFLGSMNWLDGKGVARDRVETPIGIVTAPGATIGAAVKIGIRPEKIRLSASPIEGGNAFHGRCIGSSFLGDHKLYRIRIGATAIVVKQSGIFLPDGPDRDLHLAFPDESVLVFPAEQEAEPPVRAAQPVPA